MSDELKPCAHCGHKGETEEWKHADWSEWRVVCERCRISTVWYPAPEYAIAAWNTRADDAQIAANDNLSAETAISADGHACNDAVVDSRADELDCGTAEGCASQVPQSDSRDQLEADILAWRGKPSTIVNMIPAWLDRQAAITRAEWCSEQGWWDSAEECNRATAKVYDLQAQVDNLTAERDELRDIIAHLPKTEAECEACQQAHDRLMFNAKMHQDELNEHWRKANDGWAQANAEAERWRQKCGELEAERDRLRRFVDGGAYDCMTCEAKAELAERADSLEAELARKQRACDTQRDSFLKLEAENAELRRALDGASDALKAI